MPSTTSTNSPTNDSQPQVVERKLSDLKEHPLQSQYFPTPSEAANLELAADMDVNGQEVEIDILPDGTILGGHRRVCAARSLGWETIRAIVHYELADDPEAAEAFFINDNYTRRQLTMLQKVRCAKRRFELAEQGKVALPEEYNELVETRDKLGWLMEMSGRNAERYLKVLEGAPIEVQHALDAGHLGIIDAGKIAGFSKEKQALIATELRDQGLQNAKTIYDAHRPSKAATRRGAESVWFEFRRAAKAAKEELADNLRALHIWLDQDDLDLINGIEEDVFAPLKILIEEKLEDEELELTN